MYEKNLKQIKKFLEKIKLKNKTLDYLNFLHKF